ncbi:hypothetical protein BVC93_25240 [Mycobacterium sp. MS1601]|uniref:hypothetical protein n=1 Tax=Mycobacterium sp. MS1601 TaxID=1936029 RepID=UPI00097928A8|nr:hypothetical protein [Mycobacterium sp. MS1601]AQA05161.1 hypothetical protein BVC93_25240 [Mycobacterium sp. MS1601]
MTWRSTVHVLAVAVVIAAAAFLWHNLPRNSQIYAPFDVTTDAGTPATGRNVTATVLGTQITRVVEPESGRPSRLEAAGVWVVVNAEVAALDEPGRLWVQLEVGPDTYTSTDRLPPTATPGGTMQPSMNYRADWVFDVAPDMLARVDDVRLRVWLDDGRLDSRLVIRIPLEGPGVSNLDRVRLPRPAVSA